MLSDPLSSLPLLACLAFSVFLIRRIWAFFVSWFSCHPSLLWLPWLSLLSWLSWAIDAFWLPLLPWLSWLLLPFHPVGSLSFPSSLCSLCSRVFWMLLAPIGLLQFLSPLCSLGCLGLLILLYSSHCFTWLSWPLDAFGSLVFPASPGSLRSRRFSILLAPSAPSAAWTLLAVLAARWLWPSCLPSLS